MRFMCDRASRQDTRGPVGYHNVSVSFGGAFAGAAARTDTLPTLLHPSTGHPYHLQIFPVVASVSPGGGLPCSGTVVTIIGAGFPVVVPNEEAMPDGDLDIRISGVRCSVTWSNGTALQCTAWRHPRYAACVAGNVFESVPALDGLVAGMRGVLWETFPATAAVGVEVDVDAWRASLPAPHTQAGRGVRQTMDADNFTLPWAARTAPARGAAVLTAPVTGTCLW